MSRYLLLIILNIPFVLMGIISSITQYKLSRISSKNFVIHIFFWFFIILSLVIAEPLYNKLYSAGLTNTESLSLFDVIQITAIIFLLYGINRARIKLKLLDRKVQDLHQEISIILSTKK